ncbi:MAG: TonB family protein, partial [Candidatus Eremiobacteraeota bacterium]|nr:TonB family protein [Candidatus Eremiobacteraeota bacterium]
GLSTRKLDFGMLRADEADTQLGMAADVKGSGNFPDSGARADFLAYPLNANQSAVLLFDDATKRLTEIFYGDRAFLARSGLLSDSSTDSGGHFSAPVLQHEGAADYPPTVKQGDAFLRLSVDTHGAVANAEVFVSSGDPQLDRAALVSARHDVFAPGTLAGSPVEAIVFVREEFRQLH